MLTVTKKFTFEYAHRLPNYEGDCCNIHGHHGVALVTVSGMVDQRTGMIVDFKILKKDLEPVFKKLDHAFLNDFIENPTAEHITNWLVAEIRKVDVFYKENLQRLQVYETPDCFAEWTQC